MRNKGFTLIELLGVIVILAIIFVLIYPAVTNIINDSKETVYTKQINAILNAAYDFSLKNLSFLPDSKNKKFITLGHLKNEGFLDYNIKNPENDELFSDNLVISIYNVGAGYENNKDNSILKGDYLYTVEIDKLNNVEDKTLLPTITLTVENDNKLIKNSNNNYTYNLELKDRFPKIEITSTSSSGDDLTENVKSYIMQNDKIVQNIDSSTPTIYKIYYSVVDNKGYSSLVILSVIVSDTIPPIITFPENTVISKDITNFDLLKDVNCEDNSGFCEITNISKLDYGIVGMHTIEYGAKDPSGNTSTFKRVIEIE